MCLSVCHFVLVFFSPFNIAITSLGEERANVSAFRTFVRFVLVYICRFPLPLGVWEGLRLVIVALPGLSLIFFSLTFFTLLTVLRRWSRCWSYSLLLCGLFYEAICFMNYLVSFCSCVFSVLLALRLPRLGKRELIVMLFVRLFDLCLFGFVVFLFLLVSGKGCGL